MDEGVTLVLGGLGIKGVSNLGTLEAIQQSGMPVKKIVASGVSSIIAAQFCLGRDLNTLTDLFTRFFTENHRYLWGLERLAGMSRSRTRRVRDSFQYFLRERLYCQMNFKSLSVLPWDLLEEDLQLFFGQVKASDLCTPLAISAIDLNLGQEILLEKGNLVKRLKAGIAFPGLFPPVKIGRKEYVSSTFYCELPLGCLGVSDHPVVAVDIPAHYTAERPSNIIETLARVDELRSIRIKERLLREADRVFTLEGLRGYPWGSYRQIPRQIMQARSEMEMLLNLS